MPGITRRAHNTSALQVLQMRATLFAVGFMPLLDAASVSIKSAELLDAI